MGYDYPTSRGTDTNDSVCTPRTHSSKYEKRPIPQMKLLADLGPEESALGKALQQLRSNNQKLQNENNTSLSLEELSKLGNMLFKLVEKQQGDNLFATASASANFSMAIELLHACLSKMWEADTKTHSLQKQVNKMTIEARSLMERDQALTNMMAIMKKQRIEIDFKSNYVEQENEMLQQQIRVYEKTLERDLLQVNPNIMNEIRMRFKLDMSRMMALATPPFVEQDNAKAHTIEFDQVMYHSRVQHCFGEMVRKAQAEQLTKIRDLLLKSDLVKKVSISKAQAKLEEEFRGKLHKEMTNVMMRTSAIKRSLTRSESDESNVSKEIVSVFKEAEKPFKQLFLSWDSLSGVQLLVDIMKQQEKDNIAMSQSTKQALDEAAKLNAYKENILFQLKASKKLLKVEILEIMQDFRSTIDFMTEKVMSSAANSLIDDPNLKKSSKKDKATLEVYHNLNKALKRTGVFAEEIKTQFGELKDNF